MVSGKKAAKRGREEEIEFVDLFNQNPKFRQVFALSIGIDPHNSHAILKGGSSTKVDVSIKNDQGIIGLSIKTAEADFNQLERIWLSDLKKRIDMPDQIYKMFEDCIECRRLDPSGPFILPKYESEIKAYFKQNLKKLLEELFTRGDTKLRFLVVVDYVAKSWYLLPLPVVYDHLMKQEISFSKKGVMKLGSILSLQKKGGNGAHIKVPKWNPSHPGNQLQFKINPLTLVKELNIFPLIQLYNG